MVIILTQVRLDGKMSCLCKWSFNLHGFSDIFMCLLSREAIDVRENIHVKRENSKRDKKWDQFSFDLSGTWMMMQCFILSLLST